MSDLLHWLLADGAAQAWIGVGIGSVIAILIGVDIGRRTSRY